MKIGITGGSGFIGWHLRCYVSTLDYVDEVRIADRNTFSVAGLLECFVDGLDLVVHLAGVNRADDNELLNGNAQPAQLLVAALDAKNDTACIVYASSTYAAIANSAYGRGKADAGKIIGNWANKSKGRFINMIIPHVFGEYGKPFYNSAMATFCHQIARGEEVSVNSDGQLELVHVQDLVEIFISVYDDGREGDIRVSGKNIRVSDAASRLQDLYEEYMIQKRLPDLSNPFDRSLFNALRGALIQDDRLTAPVKHSDERGWLVETVKAGSGGQCFVSTTKPGITRGNHFHRRKVERFFVLQGKGQIKLRKLFTDDVIVYDLDGDSPSYVDIPTLHTHSITNTGDTELITLFWADEFYDPENSDTYFENV